jgi:hypothetical protein
MKSEERWFGREPVRYMWSTGAAEGGPYRIERSMPTERRLIRSGQGRDRERVDGKRMTTTIGERWRMK